MWTPVPGTPPAIKDGPDNVNIRGKNSDDLTNPGVQPL
jgi:hypothetical protein